MAFILCKNVTLVTSSFYQQTMYNDKFDAELQIDLEEAISAHLFHAIREYGHSENECFIDEERCNQFGRDILGLIVERLRPDLIEGEGSVAEDAIDRLLRKKSLSSTLKINITYYDVIEVFRMINIWFIGFIPSEELLQPVRKILSISGFNEFRGPHTQPNNINIIMPQEGWSAQEVALALKEEWQSQFEVEVSRNKSESLDQG